MPFPVVAFSATDDSTAALAEFIPPCCVFTQFREDICEAIIARQAKMWKKGKGYHVAIVCDDIFYGALGLPAFPHIIPTQLNPPTMPNPDKKIFTTRVFRCVRCNAREGYRPPSPPRRAQGNDDEWATQKDMPPHGCTVRGGEPCMRGVAEY